MSIRSDRLRGQIVWSLKKRPKIVAEMFGFSVRYWKARMVTGRVRRARWERMPDDVRRRVYPMDDLLRAMGEMSGAGVVYRDAKKRGAFILPSTHVGQREACRMFGVSLPEWRNWEREGRIRCGVRVKGSRIYPIDELERLLLEFGRESKAEMMKHPTDDSSVAARKIHRERDGVLELAKAA